MLKKYPLYFFTLIITLFFPRQVLVAPVNSPSLTTNSNVVETAQNLGFPPLQPGMSVIGPFIGPENSIVYMDNTGKVSYFVPERMTVFFGIMDGNNVPTLVYALTPVANYRIENNQFILLSDPPMEVFNWPYSEPMVNVLIATLQQYLTQVQTQPQNVYAPWETQSVINNSLHEINMNILENMGNQGCTEYYEGVYYLGCW